MLNFLAVHILNVEYSNSRCKQSVCLGLIRTVHPLIKTSSPYHRETKPLACLHHFLEGNLKQRGNISGFLLGYERKHTPKNNTLKTQDVSFKTRQQVYGDVSILFQSNFKTRLTIGHGEFQTHRLPKLSECIYDREELVSVYIIHVPQNFSLYIYDAYSCPVVPLRTTACHRRSCNRTPRPANKSIQ